MWPLLLINIAVCVAVVLKILTILQSLVWAERYGATYRERLEELRGASRMRTPTLEELVAKIADLEPERVKPFGLAETTGSLAAARYIQSSSKYMRAKGHLLRTAVRSFNFPLMALVGATIVTITGLRAEVVSGAAVLIVSARLTALLMIVGILILAVNATVLYSRVGMYALAFDRPLKYVRNKNLNLFMTEVITITGLAMCTLLIDASTLSLFVNTGAKFANADLSGLGNLFNDLYHAAMTFIFSTQLEPISFWSKLLVLLFSLQGVSILILTFAALTSSVPIRQSQ
jgi:hypothetical protein